MQACGQPVMQIPEGFTASLTDATHRFVQVLFPHLEPTVPASVQKISSVIQKPQKSSQGVTER